MLNKIPFEIAGVGTKKIFIEKWARQFCIRKKMPNPVFWGSIQSDSFLTKNWQKYLFLGGIGLVALEGIGKGYPVLISSMAGLCFFVNRKNIVSAWTYNFSPYRKENCNKFYEDIFSSATDYQKLAKGDLSFMPLNIPDCMQFVSVFNKYKN